MKPILVDQLQQQRQQVLAEIQQLPPMRRGSITQQYVNTTRKDGTQLKRGPYWIYTFKDAHQKTVSRYLRDPQQIQAYRQQIDAFRRFQTLSRQLLVLSEQLGDAALGSPEALKKTSPSKSSSKPK